MLPHPLLAGPPLVGWSGVFYVILGGKVAGFQLTASPADPGSGGYPVPPSFAVR